MSTSPDPIVGIDLGTTYSLIAICDERGPRIIPDEQGRPLVPSVVRYEADPSGHSVDGPAPGLAPVRAVVGWPAKEAQARNPLTTIFSAKRLMGRSLQDATPDLAFLPYRIVAGEHNTARIEVPLAPSPGSAGEGGVRAPSSTLPSPDRPQQRGASPSSRIFSPQEVSASILRHLKDQASRALNSEIKKAVVTVPAYFDDAQRQATRDAGRLAGLEVVRIVNEPTAAALAYGLGLERAGDRHKSKPSTVVVYDLGGGTFDVSILRLTPGQAAGETSFFQVLATAGDTHLGGDDIDNTIAEHLLRAAGVDPASLSPGARSRLTKAAEQAKRELSTQEQTTISVSLVDGLGGAGADDGSGAVFTHTLDRRQLETLIEPFAARSLAACDRALRDARKHLDVSSHVGAAVPSPSPSALAEGVAESARPGEVPLPAAIEPPATPPTGGGASPSSFIDAVVLVGGSTRIPLIRRRVAEFFGLVPYTALDPDQVVALGAAVQASILSGQSKQALLLDVIPLSLGLETVGGAVAKLIMRNTTVPARASEMFSTSIDNQTSIKLNILQGEREMAADCRSLGEFHLRGLPPMPAGIPQVEVVFLIDANGVLNVSAVERRSGKRASIQIIPNHGLTREEVDRIEAESYAHAREDMAHHRIVDLIANSKLDLKWINDRFRALAEKLDAGYRASLSARLDELAALTAAAEKDWRSVNPDRFHRAKEALDRESVRLHEISIAESLKGQGAS